MIASYKGRWTIGTCLGALAAVTAWPAAGQAQSETSPTATVADVATASPAGLAPQPSAEGGTTGDIVVTGSRLGRTGFNTPTPVTVVGAAEVARQAAPNIAEVLNQVPAFRATGTPATSAVFVGNLGASTADLRGLGANRTLVLINGRRVVASTVVGTFVPANAVDLNMVPTSLIDRSEVVTGGASAAYGSDAVAGVVNIVLNTKLDGVRATAQYGQTDHNDAKDYVASLAYGTGIGSRGHLIVGAEYQNNKGTGDCYSRAWCARGVNVITNPSFRTNGLPAQLLLNNTTTSTATFNGIINGGPLNGLEFAPDGQSTFRHNYGTYYGAGIFQAGGGDGVQPYYLNFPLSGPVSRVASFLHANYDLTDTVNAYVEGSYARSHGAQPLAQIRDTNITIRADNAYLPASVRAAMAANGLATVAFGRIGQDLGPGYGRVNRATYRGVGGFEWKLGDKWRVNAYAQVGQTNYRQQTENNRINDRFTLAVDAVAGPNGSIVCRSTLTNPSNGCSPLNLFGQNKFSAAAKAYAYGTGVQTAKLKQEVYSADIRGDLFDLWAGPVSVAFGGEHRRDRVSGTSDPISTAAGFYTGNSGPIQGSLSVNEGFVEVGVPLARDAGFAHALDLNGALRYTDYSISGGVTSWKLGATFEPVSQLRFRVTRSRDIRAPNLFELYSARSTSFTFLSDPQRSGASSLTLLLLGGNSALKPEIAKTWTVGTVLQPDFWGLNRLRLSVDYYDIKLNGAIATLGGQVILNLCGAGGNPICAQVSRDAAGNILSVSNANLNLNRLQTRGVDIEGSYSLPLSEISSSWQGNLGLRVLATRVGRLTTTSPTGAVQNRAGQNGAPVGAPAGVPRWQANGFITYTGNPFSAQVQLRYISPGTIDAAAVGPGQDGYSTTLANSINDNHLPAYLYVNVNAQLTLLSRDRQRVELFGAVNNIADRDPPPIPTSFGSTNNFLYDVLGRTYRIGVRFTY